VDGIVKIPKVLYKIALNTLHGGVLIGVVARGRKSLLSTLRLNVVSPNNMKIFKSFTRFTEINYR
jgi:hypothetical protein